MLYEVITSAGEQSVLLAVIFNQLMPSDLRNAVNRTRPKRRGFILGSMSYGTKHLAGSSKEKTTRGRVLYQRRQQIVRPPDVIPQSYNFV